MQLSILTAQDALEQLANSWPSLQSRCAHGDNSNSYLRLAVHLKDKPQSELMVLCVHDGNPREELHALCIVENQRHWIASKHCLANWISEPGLDSTPLVAREQLFSALTALLRELPSAQAGNIMSLRHLLPAQPIAHALLAICEQQQLIAKVSSERKGSLCEISIPLGSQATRQNPLKSQHEFNSLRSLP